MKWVWGMLAFFGSVGALMAAVGFLFNVGVLDISGVVVFGLLGGPVCAVVGITTFERVEG